MKRLNWAAAALGLVALSGCVAPVGPVEVTRFHVPDTAALGKGTISVEPAAGSDGSSLEWKTYQVAVMRQLVLLGYSEAAPGQGAQVAQLRFSRGTFQPERSGSSVGVGLGGSTGSYGSGSDWGSGSTFAQARSAGPVRPCGGNPRPSERYRAVGRAGELCGPLVLAARGNGAGGAKNGRGAVQGLPRTVG